MRATTYRVGPGLLLALGVALAGCEGERSRGLAPAEVTGGPRVIYDIEARPLPDIPLPNDQATRLDPDSPTGRRVNVSLEAPTAHERLVRAGFNEMDGFGTFAPIFVSFDARLDLRDIQRRYADDDFRDDPLFLLNVDRSCSRFGEEVALDMGRGRFPVPLWSRARMTPDPEAPGGFVLGRGNLFFPFDPNGHANNLLFEEFDEDVDGDGVLDPGEDLDDDGVLDRPNFIDPDACAGETPGTADHDRCVIDNLLTWYETETETLILRPLWPLEQRCTYAVVLTDRLRGVDGQPVRSPFAGVNPRSQTEALAPIGELLPRYGLGVGDVAFAWTFTTGSMTHDLRALRAGLYGAGPFERLADEFPVQSLDLWTRAELGGEGDDVLLPGACAGGAISALWTLRSEWEPNRCAIEGDMASLGGVFGGTFAAPDLMVDRDGIATPNYPADDDERWQLDPERGEAVYGETRPTFWCFVPHETAECPEGNPEGTPFCKPFPVVIYGHGYGGSRIEPIVGHIGRTTAMGYALCALDAYGHGLDVLRRGLAGELPPGAALDDTTLFRIASGVFRRFGVPELTEMALRGRDRDLDNNGIPDSGADQWTADLLHTRDTVRQTSLEHMQFVRILRAMDGQTRGAGGGLLGDLDGDGVVDIGGPKTTVAMWGISLGGIISGVLAGAEPSLDAASPNAGGGGLVDVSMRSSQAGVPDAVVMPMLGQLVGGCLGTDEHQRPVGPDQLSVGDCFGKDLGDGDPHPGGVLRLALFAQNLARLRIHHFAEVEGVEVGDRVVLRNVTSGEEDWATVGPRGWLRLGVATDALSPSERRPLIGLAADDAIGPVVVDDPVALGLGDALELIVYAGDTDTVKAVVDSFEIEVSFQGTTYPVGAPLVALQDGLGFQRNTPAFRRFVGLAQSGIGPADPAIWAAHTALEPFDARYDPTWTPGKTRVLHMPTAGDANVPVNTGIAMARAAGTLGSWLRDTSIGPEYGWRELFVPDPRWGKSPDQVLVDTFVVEGVGRLERYADNPVSAEAVFDVDDISDGQAEFSCGDSDWSAIAGEQGCPDDRRGEEVFFPLPRPEDGLALRHDRPRGDGTVDAIRVPVLRPNGQHGIYNAQAFRVFDTDAYMVNFTTRFLGSRGADTRHAPGCDCSASSLPAFTLGGEPQHPALGRACTPDDMKVCDAACAAAWGIVTPEASACDP